MQGYDMTDTLKLATEVWQTSHWTSEQLKRLERFSELVAAQERESCAKVVHDYAESIYLFQNESQLIEAEKRIRARSKT